jgi:hypothetical protein
VGSSADGTKRLAAARGGPLYLYSGSAWMATANAEQQLEFRRLLSRWDQIGGCRFLYGCLGANLLLD